MTPDGVITEFPVALSPGQTLFGGGIGPDGNIWVLARTPGGIGRFDLSTHALTMFSAGLNAGNSVGTLVKGSDLNAWATDAGATQGIARIGTGVCDRSLERCNLQQTNLQNVVLVGANLRGDHLQEAQLQNARLIGASLQGAHLQQANLGSAQLQYAHLAGAYLQGADLSGPTSAVPSSAVRNCRGTTVTGTIWSNTTCPDGSISDDDGGSCTLGT
jgi:uncharacterized protein YjbI with pentapeptide repeats